MLPIPKNPREFVELVRRIRGPAYARFARAMLWIGASLVAVSVPVLVIQLLAGVYGAAQGNDAPWWVAAGTGILLIVGGIVLFVWFYSRDPDRLKGSPLPTEGSISFLVPQAMTFAQVAEMLGRHVRRNVRLQGFNDDELHAQLKSQALECADVVEALLELGPLAMNRTVRKYEVTEEGQQLVLRPTTP